MKCPKCHYLSFDPEPRCRNCGYTLSLDEDLAIHPASEDLALPFADLALRGEESVPDEAASPARPGAPPPRRAPAPTPPGRRNRTSTPGPFDDVIVGATEEPPSAGSPAAGDPPPRRPAPPTGELPLFMKGMAPAADSEGEGAAAMPPLDEPLIALRASPLPPLAVRRSVPESQGRGRPADGRSLGPLDRDLLEGLQRIEHAEQQSAAADVRRANLQNAAGAGRRLGAAVIDALLLSGVAGSVVWITLRWADLSWPQIGQLPTLPLAGFVLLIVVGYLFMFTAAIGQTAGKLLTGIRVVAVAPPGGAEQPPTMRQVLCREALTVPSVLLLGAGFIPGLFGEERALHDRLTRTRVVRA